MKAGPREALKRRIVARYSTRIHMSMILASTCLVGMMASWLLLHAGLHDMRVRYPLVITAAYLTFLSGIWVWLRACGFARGSGSGDGSSFLDGWGGSSSKGSGGWFESVGRGGVPKGGGGTFDGGGASGSWAEGGAVRTVAIVPANAAEDGGSGAGDAVKDLGGGAIDGGDETVLVILIIALVFAVFAASGYLVWMAPDIFTEAAFGTLLAGGLSRPRKGESDSGWLWGAVKKTWWPFAIVLVVALAFASYAARFDPVPKTLREAIHVAAQS